MDDSEKYPGRQNEEERLFLSRHSYEVKGISTAEIADEMQRILLQHGYKARIYDKYAVAYFKDDEREIPFRKEPVLLHRCKWGLPNRGVVAQKVQTATGLCIVLRQNTHDYLEAHNLIRKVISNIFRTDQHKITPDPKQWNPIFRPEEVITYTFSEPINTPSQSVIDEIHDKFGKLFRVGAVIKAN